MELSIYKNKKRMVFIILKICRKVNNKGEYIHKVQGFLLFIILLGVAILVFIQVILRYVLHYPLMGIEELLLFPAIWLYFLGNANAALERNQIKAQVIDVFLKSPKIIKIFKILTTVTYFIINCWLTYWAYQYFQYSVRVHKLSATLYFPLVYAESAVFICFLLVGIYTFFEIKEYIKRPVNKFGINTKKK